MQRWSTLALGVASLLNLAGCGGRGSSSDAETNSSEDGINFEDDGSADTSSASSASSGPLLDVAGGTTQAEMPEGGDTECAEVDVATDPVIPTVILLVDQSGSMTETFDNNQDRWDAVYDTLMDPAGGVVKPLESTVRFGLTLYSSEGGNNGGTCPILTEVAPALDNHGAIDAVYAMSAPLSDTPTGESLAAVAANLIALQVNGPKVIVLATDGEPDTCAEPNPQNGQPEAIAAAEAAFAMGIQTYIISVGDDVSMQHLQEMANAGVGLDPQGQDLAPYYQALDAGELIAAFDEIISGFISCTLELDGIVDLEQVCEGTVWLDDDELECNVDWELSDPSTLVLLGQACATLQDGDPHSVTASWPCGAVAIQ